MMDRESVERFWNTGGKIAEDRTLTDLQKEICIYLASSAPAHVAASYENIRQLKAFKRIKVGELFQILSTSVVLHHAWYYQYEPGFKRWSIIQWKPILFCQEGMYR